MPQIHDDKKPLSRTFRLEKGPMNLEEYRKTGGYQAVHKALKEMSPEEVTAEVKDSHLRGRGGAGFPTGMKWSFVPVGKEAPRPKFLLANADEMEPGTFKDRYLLEQAPHLFIEALIVAGYAIQAAEGIIFLRWAYKRAERCLQKAIDEASSAGYLGDNIYGSGFNFQLKIHLSAGRYICGEETALLNATENRRAIPRAKPPFPPVSGVWGKPTVVNNVETLCNVPYIITHGAQAFRSLSRTEDGGTKLYGMSGRVKRPGLWELPMGTTIREILEDQAGGMQDGFQFRALLPGGASTDFMLPEHFDIPMDYTAPAKQGARLGTGTMIVLDDRTCPVGMVHNMEKFFAQESCGWCTPCREGLPWIEKMLKAIESGEGEPSDLELLARHCTFLDLGHTFCALAPGAIGPLKSAIKYFGDDFQQHLTEKRCPWREGARG